MRDECTMRLLDATIVAVVRDRSEEHVRRVVAGLVEGGIRALEVTVPTPGCFSVLHEMARSPIQATLTTGVGTVKTVDEVHRARDAGASFVVSPHTDVRLIEAAQAAGMVCIPGALTPTEVLTAHGAGADFVKVFPVSAVGGAKYVQQLKGPIPEVRLWVSGTVQIEEIEEYIAADTALIGLTSALTADLVSDPTATVRTRTARALDALGRAREARPLLTIRGVQDNKLEVGIKELRALGAEERVLLETILPERRGQAVRLRTLLASAGVPEDAEVEIASLDGQFKRVVNAKSLYASGYLHYATDGQPLGMSGGGPLRLYIAGGDKACDNVKGLSQITLVRA
jgi:2-dehydro-3-deoxyphosphogluconate aldolase/(4S)-4-hydroxy-2-oxoglutarate aldolase